MATVHKKLSIVVPCFNEAECIDRFVDAIFSLGLQNPLEIVFVDDGSRDDTLAVIKGLAKHDARIFLRQFFKELWQGVGHFCWAEKDQWRLGGYDGCRSSASSESFERYGQGD